MSLNSIADDGYLVPIPKKPAKAMLGDRHALASAAASELLGIGGVELLTSDRPEEWSATMGSLARTGGRKSAVFGAELKFAREIVREVMTSA